MDGVFLTLKAIETREIKGTFKKFYYFCNGYPCIVYCYNDDDFRKLFSHWQALTDRGCLSKLYEYTLSTDLIREILPHPMSLEEIHGDRPFKLKLFLSCGYTGVCYIQ